MGARARTQLRAYSPTRPPAHFDHPPTHLDPHTHTQVRGVAAVRTHTGGNATSTPAPSSFTPAPSTSTSKPLLGPDAHPRFLFWVDGGYASREGGLGGRGASGLADDLQALMECPPEAPAADGGDGSRPMGAPVKLGPLPRQLLEDLVRGMGRQLLPDGRVAPIGADAGGGASIDDAWDQPAGGTSRHRSIAITSGISSAGGEAERVRAARTEAREQVRWASASNDHTLSQCQLRCSCP